MFVHVTCAHWRGVETQGTAHGIVYLRGRRSRVLFPGLGKPSPVRRPLLPHFTSECAVVWTLEEVGVGEAESARLEMRLERRREGPGAPCLARRALKPPLLTPAALLGPRLQEGAPPTPASCSPRVRPCLCVPEAADHVQKHGLRRSAELCRAAETCKSGKRSRRAEALGGGKQSEVQGLPEVWRGRAGFDCLSFPSNVRPAPCLRLAVSWSYLRPLSSARVSGVVLCSGDSRF